MFLCVMIQRVTLYNNMVVVLKVYIFVAVLRVLAWFLLLAQGFECFLELLCYFIVELTLFLGIVMLLENKMHIVYVVSISKTGTPSKLLNFYIIPIVFVQVVEKLHGLDFQLA